MPTPLSLSTHQLTPPTFSIITVHNGNGENDDPLFCSVASLADQEGIKSEQILQHTGGTTNLWSRLSRELTLSKRAPRYTLRLLEEKSPNVSDALQSGITRATGSIIGFLQPEEQYLPGALIAVEKEFLAHPEIDVIMTSALYLDPTTKKITAHAAIPFSLEYFWTCPPPILPSTLFFRTSLLAKTDVFNSSNGKMAFAECLLQLLQAGKKISTLNIFVSLAQKQTETSATSFHQAAPASMRFLRPWWRLRHARATAQAKSAAPEIHCAIYQPNSFTQRTKLI